jgi:photosystem II oxygen-evolving enhancer protein 3
MRASFLIVFLTLVSTFFISIVFHRVPIASQQDTRRDALAGIAAAGAALVPAAANASAGESPRFSVFGLLGDGTSYSEGAAYGSDQAGNTYSPYSVYGKAGEKSLYKAGDDQYIAKKKAVLEETSKRLAKLEGYSKKKQWFEVNDELRRYMYETRGAISYLAKSKEQKKAATAFYQAIEETSLGATQKNEAKCTAGAMESVSKFEALRAVL